MGLAASQARFLGITARKADCEYKSTELAQQKLEITNQLSDVAMDYSNALNSTKLMWQNEAVGRDYGVTYSLLMTPSAMNDFNPFLITTASGAIVLNPEYAEAARIAGIGKSGGIGSQASRDKFIAALVPAGIITQESAVAITKTDYAAVKDKTGKVTLTELSPTATPDGNAPVANSSMVSWNPYAGLGSAPLNKGGAEIMTLKDLIMSESIGRKPIDWTAMFANSSQITETEYNRGLNELTKALDVAQAGYDSKNPEDTSPEAQAEFDTKMQKYEADIATARNNGDENTLNRLLKEKDVYRKENAIKAANYDIEQYKKAYADNKLDFEKVKDKLQTDKSEIKDSSISQVTNNNKKEYNVNGVTVVNNGIINRYASDLEEMTIGDILSGNVVLMIQNGNKDESAKALSEITGKLMEYIARVFGYGQDGVGLNVDDASAEALEYALMMLEKQCLKPGNTISVGSRKSDNNLTENSAYLNAESSNRISQDKDGTYTAVSLSNMLSSFLTYFDNYISGVNSNYVVGQTLDTSAFVTDNTSYVYIGQSNEQLVERDRKLADFFDEIYNNICEHGWREDAGIDDYEYLESVIKDGRYSMSSLNNDGYYYQTRYNETGYMVEVSDTDAIARAEAEYTQKKAELTYKEDSIDIKTKRLDAEISTLSTEYDTVKSLISKSIEKTFTMFSG